MRIFIVGNINAGKTFVANKLRNTFPEYKILSIDDYRVKYSDGSIEKELQTRQIFADDIIKYKNAIIEFSGGENITSLFIDKLRKNSTIIIEVEENLDVCLERIKAKDFSKIPYPIFDEKMEDTIKRLDQEFKNNLIDRNFKNKVLKKYKFSTYKGSIIDLPLKQYEMTIQLIDALDKKYNRLFTFGSLAREDVKKTSDIDLFLVTKKRVNKVIEDFKKVFPDSEYIVQRNQIAIFIDQQLLEINVIRTISEAKLFYVKSEIKNIDKTVLLGDGKLVTRLNSIILNWQENFIDEFDYTLARLKYYSKSLERIIRKDDVYKFYFHNNIVIHEIVKLKYFMSGKREFSYLPKCATKYIDLTILENLQFNVEDNMEKHNELVNKIANEVITEANEYRKQL